MNHINYENMQNNTISYRICLKKHLLGISLICDIINYESELKI
jgi:hypothetical protein